LIEVKKKICIKIKRIISGLDKFKLKWIQLIVIPTIGVIISLSIFTSMMRDENRLLANKFEYDSTERFNSINRIIDYNHNVLISIRNFFYGSNFVDRDEFGNFVSSFLESDAEISSIGWFPKIGKDEISEYEYLYSDSLIDSNKIFSLEDKKLNYYYPLTYLEPHRVDYQYYGLDLSFFYDESMHSITNSIQSGSIVLLPSDFMNDRFSIENSIIMMLPVYLGKRSPQANNRNLENIKGFVFAVISVEGLIEKSLMYFEQKDIQLNLEYGFELPIINQKFFKTSFLGKSEKSWAMFSIAGDLYEKNNLTNTPFLVLIFTLLFTVMVSFYLYRNIGYTNKIEKIVEKRSRELLISQKRLDLAVEGGELGCWELDFLTGEITTNSLLSEMMGYDSNVINSLETFFNMIHSDDRPDAIAKFKQHISGKSLFFESEHRIRTKNNHWLWILTKGQIVEKDDEGNPLQLSGVQIDISKMKNMQNILLQEANIDELTGLYNRRYFNKRLKELVEKAKRMNVTFSIAILDIDLFKTVNDTYGHKCGDFILKEFALFLQKSLRPYDFIGRIGGEEFEIAFENESLESATKVMERIRGNFENKVHLYKDEELKITFSSGLSSYSEVIWNGGDEEELFSLADKRLYHAKNTGRNKVVFKLD